MRDGGADEPGSSWRDRGADGAAARESPDRRERGERETDGSTPRTRIDDAFGRRGIDGAMRVRDAAGSRVGAVRLAAPPSARWRARRVQRRRCRCEGNSVARQLADLSERGTAPLWRRPCSAPQASGALPRTEYAPSARSRPRRTACCATTTCGCDAWHEARAGTTVHAIHGP